MLKQKTINRTCVCARVVSRGRPSHLLFCSTNDIDLQMKTLRTTCIYSSSSYIYSLEEGEKRERETIVGPSLSLSRRLSSLVVREEAIKEEEEEYIQ